MKVKSFLATVLAVVLTAGGIPITVFAQQEDKPSARIKTAATEERGMDAATTEGQETNKDTAGFSANGSITIDLDSLFDVLFPEGSKTKLSFHGQEWNPGEMIEGFLGAGLTNHSEESTGKEAGKILFGKVITDGSRLNLRTGSGTDFPVIGQLAPGDEVKVLEEENGWYKVEVTQKIGYICGEYLAITETNQETTSENTFTFDDGFLKLFFDLIMQAINGKQETEQETGLTPNGNLTLVDDINSDNTQGKQFITVVTKAGNYFYLVIDRDDKGNENVHFLNMVDEADLLALMDEDEAAKHTGQTAEISENQKSTAETTESTKPAETESPEDIKLDKNMENKKSGIKMVPILLIVFLAAAGGGAFLIQIKKKKKEQEKPDPDADYWELDDEDDGIILPDDVDMESKADDEIDDDTDDNDMEPV